MNGAFSSEARAFAATLCIVMASATGCATSSAIPGVDTPPKTSAEGPAATDTLLGPREAEAAVPSVAPVEPKAEPIGLAEVEADADAAASSQQCAVVCEHLSAIVSPKGQAAQRRLWQTRCVSRCAAHAGPGQLQCLSRVTKAEHIASCQAR